MSKIENHYRAVWKAVPVKEHWEKGPIADLPEDFCVLKFQPTVNRNSWTYSTCGLSLKGDPGLEIFLLSPTEAAAHVELLTAIAHYHTTEAALGLGHTVNFGRPWLPNSDCCFGLISLPFLDGPKLEHLSLDNGRQARVLWLIPITFREKEFLNKNGLEALEQKLESENFNYLDPFRKSTI